MIIETEEREVFVLSWPYAVLSTTIRTGSDGVLESAESLCKNVVIIMRIIAQLNTILL